MHKIHYVIIIWEKSECLHIGFIDYLSISRSHTGASDFEEEGCLEQLTEILTTCYVHGQ